ncbi:MAG: LPS export ABC transporter permease LptG [Methylocystis sp.]|jgi:lipopolysaccharide export system permease protein
MIGVTLSRYLAWRFLKTILAIFITIFCLMFVIVFVELLRRASDNPDAGPGTVAMLALMRVPYQTEMILPFAVLFGAMATFVDLTRKLELVVARASGVSVWQFLAPPLLTAFALGLFSVTAYNPVAALLKQRSDQMELELFGVQGSVRVDHGVWRRYHGVDGLAVIHATNSAKGGAELTGVSVNVYAPEGGFIERVEASRATLQPGAWLLEEAQVSAPGEPPAQVGNYLLATDVTPEELAATSAAPAAVPFWELPKMARDTSEAGLDAQGYRLQFQKLLARPLLLVAMVLVAASFSLRFFRFGGVAQTLTGGVVAGFVLYIVTEVFSDLGGAGTISPILAAWSPTLVGSMLGTLSLLHSEDG